MIRPEYPVRRAGPVARRRRLPPRQPGASRLPPPVSRAFTLLEVLVALAVLALALGALIQAGAGQARAVDHLRTRTFAEWVAADQLARARLTGDWPEIGTRRGTTRMGRHDWHWRMTVTATQEPAIRRLEVAVRREPDAPAPVTTLAGFAGRH